MALGVSEVPLLTESVLGVVFIDFFSLTVSKIIKFEAGVALFTSFGKEIEIFATGVDQLTFAVVSKI